MQAAEIVPEADWKQNDSAKWVQRPACDMPVACSSVHASSAHLLRTPAGTKCKTLVTIMSTGGVICSLVCAEAQLECGQYMNWADSTVLAAAGIGVPTQTLGLIKVTASQVRQQIVNLQQISAGLRPVSQGA